MNFNTHNAQSISEYVVAIGLIIAVLFGMRIYAQRAVQQHQARSITYMFDKYGVENKQYEPYYYTSSQGEKNTNISQHYQRTLTGERLYEDVQEQYSVSGTDVKDFTHE